MKKHITTILLILLFLVGLGLILYPTFSNWWNTFHSSKAINAYSDMVANLDEDQYEEIIAAAHEFNASRLTAGTSFSMSPEQKELYPELLNVGGDGIMGYIEIPSIGVALPIYHGTEERILQVAVGHLDWSSLPIGGESTHSVLSGHRGLPSARLFTDLDDLKEGDLFMIRVLGELLTYEVDQILIVDPTDVDSLKVEQGKDLCTLVTCTPYGINTHRLLVRGHRVENTPETELIRITANAVPLDPMIVAVIVAVPLMVLAIILLITGSRWRNRRNKLQRRF